MENVDVPRLQTERLLLREWRADDLDNHSAMAADPEVMRYLGGVNAASIAVAERLGLRLLREDEVKGIRVLLYGIDRPVPLPTTPIR